METWLLSFVLWWTSWQPYKHDTHTYGVFCFWCSAYHVTIWHSLTSLLFIYFSSYHYLDFHAEWGCLHSDSALTKNKETHNQVFKEQNKWDAEWLSESGFHQKNGSLLIFFCLLLSSHSWNETQMLLRSYISIFLWRQTDNYTFQICHWACCSLNVMTSYPTQLATVWKHYTYICYTTAHSACRWVTQVLWQVNQWRSVRLASTICIVDDTMWHHPKLLQKGGQNVKKRSLKIHQYIQN